MGKLSDYFKSLFGVPAEPLRPNDIPRNIHEDFSHEFGNRFPQQPGPNWSSPDVEWHIFQEQIPNDHDEFHGGIQEDDMFSQMEQMFESFFQGFPFSSPEFFNGPSITIEQPPLIGDGSEQQHQPTNPDEPGCLRDRMLKRPESDTQDFYGNSDRDQHSEFPADPHSWFGGLWKSPFHNHHHQPQEKIDKDLDSELESGQQSLDDILSKKQDNTLIPGTIPRPFSSQSYSSITTIDSQGNRETKTTRRDSSGREETTITRKSGDKEHTITTWKNEDGSEQTQENIENVDPDSRVPPEDRSPLSSIYDSIIDQFFRRR